MRQIGWRRPAAALCALSWVLLLGWSAPAGARAAGIEPVYGPEQVLPTLRTPVIGAEGVAADGAGDTYAIDGNRVLALAPGGVFGSERVLPFTGLNGPGGLAADPAGDVYVADTGNARVLELDAGGTVQRVLPFSGLQAPNAVAADAEGDVYVADRFAALELPAGSSSSKVLPFGSGILPTGIAVDSKGDLYVADGGGAGDVEELAAGSNSPTPVAGVNGRMVAVGGHDELYVGGHDGVEELPPTSGSGFPDSPLPLGAVTNVTGVAATARGLYVSDLGGSVYFQPAGATPPAGETLLAFTGSDPGAPTSVAADGSGNVYEVLSGHVLVQPVSGPASAARLVPIIGYADSVVADGGGNVYANVGGDPSSPLAIAQWHVGAAAASTRYQQNDRLELIAADAPGDVFWTETHQGPFADIGTAFRLGPGADAGSPLPFPSIHDPSGLVASPGGDVYVSSDGGIVRVLRAGAASSAIVPFAVQVFQLGVDQWANVYGTTNRGVVLLPAGACQADELPLPFVSVVKQDGIAVDPRGDAFVADSGAHRVAMLPAAGTEPVPVCPLRLSGFKLRAHGTGKPSLRFRLASRSARGIRTVTITLPGGPLRFAKGRHLKRGLKLSTKRSRHPAFRVDHLGGQGLTITLERAARRLSLKFGRGAIFLSPIPGSIDGEGSTAITVTGRSGPAIPLSVPTMAG